MTSDIGSLGWTGERLAEDPPPFSRPLTGNLGDLSATDYMAAERAMYRRRLADAVRQYDSRKAGVLPPVQWFAEMAGVLSEAARAYLQVTE